MCVPGKPSTCDAVIEAIDTKLSNINWLAFPEVLHTPANQEQWQVDLMAQVAVRDVNNELCCFYCLEPLETSYIIAIPIRDYVVCDGSDVGDISVICHSYCDMSSYAG